MAVVVNAQLLHFADSHSFPCSYDLMNDLMSGTLHRFWKDEFVRMIGPIGSQGEWWSGRGGRLLGYHVLTSSLTQHCFLSPHFPLADASSKTVCLDVAGGTGDIAFRIIESMRSSFFRPASKQQPEVIVCDINPHMLAVGEQRAREKGYLVSSSSSGAAEAEGSTASSSSPVASSSSSSSSSSGPSLRFLEGNAEVLSDIPDSSVDLYTIAFGIRNVTHIDQALRTAHRVLKPGGRFMCLEFSHVDVPLVKQVYDAVRVGKGRDGEGRKQGGLAQVFSLPLSLQPIHELSPLTLSAPPPCSTPLL